MAKRYIGPLTQLQIDQGIRACLDYAARLRGLVFRLFGDERGLALSLACIRVEELSKVLLLFEMRSAGDDATAWEQFWKRFTDHGEKWMAYGAKTFKDLGVLDNDSLEYFAKQHKSWARVKNHGLYVEYHHGLGFFPPGIVPGDFLEIALRMGDNLQQRIELEIVPRTT